MERQKQTLNVETLCLVSKKKPIKGITITCDFPPLNARHFEMYKPLLVGCHWMIPASLWVGLILTLILVVIGGACLKSKRRRKAGNVRCPVCENVLKNA